ncbi:MAG: hypothetical protein AB1425_11310 [Actinomycetota bacterium]
MSSFLREELGVAMSGVKWDVAGYKLWQSTRDDIVLFTPKQPRLARGENGRFQCAVSQFRQQVEDTYKITGGSAIFTITSAIEHDARAFEELKQQWLTEMNAQGPQPRVGNPRFIPLNVQKGEARVLINPRSGEPDQAHTDANIGTPGGTNSFLVNLTELGAQEWVQGIKQGRTVPAGVKMTYEYLRMMPDVGAEVRVYGRRAFRHLSTELKASARGIFYGGSASIDAAWENMSRDGTVEITFIGQLPPELEEIRRELVNTFAEQAREQLFSSLFEPAPDVEEAEAGDTGGLFGGTNFALKWRSETETTDLNLTLRFKGWTWLRASMDADLTSLFAELDETYVNEVNTEMSFPASVVVDSDQQLEHVAVSWSASEGKAPEAPVFGPQGGNEVYVVTSDAPNDVEISYNAKVNFVPSSWPVIETSGRRRIGDGGNQVVIKPASWVGRHMIYMFVRDGDEIRLAGIENDYLIVNVSYTGPHLFQPIKASARITPFEPVEFSYPLSPEGARGEAKFSAFGVIGSRLVRSPEVPINFDEEAVFILASSNDIQLVSQAAVVPETDGLAQGLLEAGARPVVGGDAAPATETGRRPRPGMNGDGRLSGTVVAVEYGIHGPALIIETAAGRRRVPIRSHELADAFDDRRKRVTVELDGDRYASEITVEL